MEKPELSLETALKLINKEIKSAKDKIDYHSYSLNIGDIEELYSASYNILWRLFGKNHRVTRRFQNLIHSRYNSYLDCYYALYGALLSAKTEIDNALCHPDEMKIYYTPIRSNDAVKDRDSGLNRRVFIVHGKNGVIRKELCGYLTKIQIEPIVLEDQLMVGTTVLDQFEHYAGLCSFAIILVTGDDFGGQYQSELFTLSDMGSNHEDETTNMISVSKVEIRARQNVILEFGYFWGLFGLDRVRVLYQEEVITPSDLHGLLSIKLDRDGIWKYKLARELDQKGIKVDMALLDPIEDFERPPQ